MSAVPETVENLGQQLMSTSPIHVGSYPDGQRAEFRWQDLTNFHMMMIGQSGVGKTYTIKLLVKQLVMMGTTCFAIDTQGDMDQIAGLDKSRIRRIDFGGENGFTINPLRVDAFEGSGGMLATIRDAIDAARIFFPNIGQRQEDVLTNILYDVYQLFGMDRNRPETWAKKKQPTWNDVLRYIEELEIYGRNTLRSSVSYEIGSLRREYMDLKKKAHDDDQPVTEEEFKNYQKRLAERCFEFIKKDFDDPVTLINNNNVEPKSDRDSYYKSINTIKYIIERMASTAYFGEDTIEPKPGALNVFNLRALHITDQQVLFRLLIDRVFNASVRRSGSSSVAPMYPRSVIVLDEGKHASATIQSQLSTLNRVLTEGRKFGLGSIIGIQNLKQITYEMMTCFAVNLAFPMHVTALQEASSKLKINKESMNLIKAKESALMMIDSGKFEKVMIGR